MLGPHTITVLNPGTKASDYGNATVEDWERPMSITVDGCSVQPGMAVEYTIDRDNTLDRWTVWVPGIDVPLTSKSRVRWRGQTYDVDGDPQVWDFPPVPHMVANLRRSEG